MDYKQELERLRAIPLDEALKKLRQRHEKANLAYQKARQDVSDIQYLINIISGVSK